MQNKVTQAMILAAGEGTRLKHLTRDNPKILQKIDVIPLIIYILKWLKYHKITAVVINLHHHGDKIKAFLSEESKFGMIIRYSPEEKLLGTAGAVKRAENYFNDTFIVVYGDLLVDFDLYKVIDFHHQNNALGTIVLVESSDIAGAGIVEIDGQNRILSLMEKPQIATSRANLINGGIYILENKIFDYIPGDTFSDFAYDIFPRLLYSGYPLYGFKLQKDDYLIDIGTIDKYRKANNDILKKKLKYCG